MGEKMAQAGGGFWEGMLAIEQNTKIVHDGWNGDGAKAYLYFFALGFDRLPKAFTFGGGGEEFKDLLFKGWVAIKGRRAGGR